MNEVWGATFCRSLYVGGVAAKVLSGYHPGYLPQLIQRKLFGGGYVSARYCCHLLRAVWHCESRQSLICSAASHSRTDWREMRVDRPVFCTFNRPDFMRA